MRTPITCALSFVLLFGIGATGFAAQNQNSDMSEKLDDLDYHVESATEQGHSEYAGGAHIAYFLTWASERDLLDAEATDEEIESTIREREPEAFEQILDWFDGVIATDFLTEAGGTFASECYETYLEEYARETGEAQYHEPNWPMYERVRVVLDRLRQHGCA